MAALDRIAARAVVLKERATKRDATAAATALEKAHGVIADAKERIAQLAKESAR